MVHSRLTFLLIDRIQFIAFDLEATLRHIDFNHCAALRCFLNAFRSEDNNGSTDKMSVSKRTSYFKSLHVFG